MCRLMKINDKLNQIKNSTIRSPLWMDNTPAKISNYNFNEMMCESKLKTNSYSNFMAKSNFVYFWKSLYFELNNLHI